MQVFLFFLETTKPPDDFFGSVVKHFVPVDDPIYQKKYVELEDSEELVTTRLKLEIPHVYEKDGQFDQEWFTSIKTKQKECLEQCLLKYNISYDEGYEEHADETNSECEMKYCTLAYKITSKEFNRSLLRATRDFLEMIQKERFPPQMTPLLNFPSHECFDPKLISCHNSVCLGSVMWGNIQGGTYFNHWEVSMDRVPTKAFRDSDCITVDFEYDRNDMIMVKFACFLNDKEDRNKPNSRIVKKRAHYKITITRSQIRRIIVDNAIDDSFCHGRVRLHFELNNPPIINRAWAADKNKPKLIYFRETTIKRGRRENEWPKDAELSNCPYFTLELAQKIENKKIYSILSRLRSRIGLPIEFGTFPMIDCFMQFDNPYFSWIQKIERKGRWVKPDPTSDKEPVFRDFVAYCFPVPAHRRTSEQMAEERVKRFVLTYLIECLLSRGAVVKDQICITKQHWLRFLKIVAGKLRADFDTTERALERLIMMIDERKRIGCISSTLTKIFDTLNAEDANPAAPTIEESRDGYQRVRKIIMTPTRTLYVVPEMMMSNRVLRKYDPYGINILRVSFRDDDGTKMRETKTGKFNVDQAVRNRLVNGIFVGGMDFGYLGSSNSQMRDHGAYFMQKMSYQDIREWRRENPNAGRMPPTSEMRQIIDVRKSLGKFEKIESIPKLMARLGQCFTQSRESGIQLPLENCANIHDIVGGRNSMGGSFTFTDGVGCISREFAKKIAEDFGISKGYPSCYQFRYRGMKGVLGVNTALDHHNLWARKRDRGPPNAKVAKDWIIHVGLRDSQEKFYGARQEYIEIVKISSPSPVALNKPFINILDQVSEMQGYSCHKRITQRIEQLLDRQMRGFASQMIDETVCRNRLKELPRRVDIDKVSTSAGFEMSNEPFFRSLIKASVKFSVTKQLRKAQIQIPFENGRTLLGIADETGRLQYGQVYCQVTKSIRDRFPNPNAAKIVLKGPVLLTKNPCIVAGDVRVFEAVDIEELHHLTDVIVFPLHGPRTHPDEMAGSDLDGDEYCVIWDKQLLLERNEEPFDFAVPKRVDEDVSMNIQQKMADFYVKYMMQDAVGTIANAFLCAADIYGLNHKVCLQLAKKNCEAVDFTKSGQPPAALTTKWEKDEDDEEIPPEKSERMPDFQVSDTNRPVYQSPRLLGKLMREIKGIENVMKIVEDKDETNPIELDKYLHVDGWEKYKVTAEEELSKYNTLLRTVMETYGIRTEAEIFSGCICEMRNRLSDKDQDDMSFFNTNNVIETKVTNIFKRFRKEFFEEFEGWIVATEKVEKPFADEYNVCHREVKTIRDGMREKAYAYYRVCYDRARESGERKLSFAWLAYDVLAHIKQIRIRDDQSFSVTGNPLFQLLEIRIADYIEENSEKYQKFRSFETRKSLQSAIEPLTKYCYKYNGLDKLLFIVHEWGNNLRLFTTRFSSAHLSLLVIMYFTNAFNSLDGDALQLIQPIPVHLRRDELQPEVFGRLSVLLVKFFEFLASRKFSRLDFISFRILGVQSLFNRGEWMRYHRAALTTYYNMVYNLRFEELPLKSEEKTVQAEIIREMEPFTFELSDEIPADDDYVAKKIVEKTKLTDIQLRRQPNNKILVSARGTLESLDALRRLVTVMPPKHSSVRGLEVQKQLFSLVFEKIMKDTFSDELLECVHYDGGDI